ncbi:hypothetical protein AC579_9869 [Pseudocercospora musae]|uniref:Uncharacterized protein n=1 Tax=Pseudocercospora musae TaxID=113226 RepID=A0A139I817_9PEZI|nr:hypothetical protein AC579_9869 [Pseudocercospora musae]
MENGQTSHGSGDRRRTVSGPLPPLNVEAEEDDMKKSPDNMKFAWSSPSAPSSPAEVPASPGKQSGHRRTLSGNLLAKFNFLKGVVEDARPPSRDKESQNAQSSKSPKSSRSGKSVDDDDAPGSPVSPEKGSSSAMASALKASKTRKRKGSLRKTALLGTRKLVTETRERRNSVMPRSPSNKQVSTPVQPEEAPSTISTDPEVSGLGLPAALRREPEVGNGVRHKFSYENVTAASSSDSGWGESAAAITARLALLTDHRVQPKQSTTLSSPLDLKSPVSNSSYASTTDDDEVLTFDHPANSFASSQSLKMPLCSGATGYFPSDETSMSEPSISRRVSSKNRSSPLSQVATTHSPYAAEPEPHDYTETEYWGWVILFVTWLTFTVGMGSCLEMWSWAWDVGETPYAPPELEDDETLPIVGYYPALMVLTGVVAWVWITVAWVGMKYFRHAKIEV